MKEDNINLILGKELDLDGNRKVTKFMAIFLLVSCFGLLVGDLFKFFYAHQIDFILSLTFMGVIIFLVIPCYFLGKMAENKNPPTTLVINENNFAIIYKNGFTRVINFEDISNVYLDIKYGRISCAYLTVRTNSEKIIVETICVGTIMTLVKFLKFHNVAIDYSNTLVKSDVEQVSNNTLFYKIWMFILLIFWITFLGWIARSALFHYGII